MNFGKELVIYKVKIALAHAHVHRYQGIPLCNLPAFCQNGRITFLMVFTVVQLYMMQGKICIYFQAFNNFLSTIDGLLTFQTNLCWGIVLVYM